MEATADSLAFAPPREPAAVRGFVLAVLAHLLLVIALSLGITWDKETPATAVEAELWSALPQEAAPPPPVPEPQPQVVQAPPPVVAPAPPPPVAREPDIAVEREKKRKEQDQRRREEEDQRRKLEAQKRKLEEQQQRKLEEQQRLAQEQKQRDEQAKKEKEKKAIDDKRMAEFRRKNLERLMTEAAGSGSPSSRGPAAQSSGPSASYAARIAGRIKPNIVFGDVVSGNPAAVLHLRVAPDGTIVGSKLVKSSGHKSWDDAVLRAVDKTERIPRDTDGRVVPEFDIEFRPKD